MEREVARLIEEEAGGAELRLADLKPGDIRAQRRYYEGRVVRPRACVRVRVGVSVGVGVRARVRARARARVRARVRVTRPSRSRPAGV
eukprot:scaffold106088_cov36-Phaeocystis_antarctica.AAC.1